MQEQDGLEMLRTSIGECGRLWSGARGGTKGTENSAQLKQADHRSTKSTHVTVSWRAKPLEVEVHVDICVEESNIESLTSVDALHNLQSNVITSTSIQLYALRRAGPSHGIFFLSGRPAGQQSSDRGTEEVYTVSCVREKIRLGIQ
jgi:hypothetical protein